MKYSTIILAAAIGIAMPCSRPDESTSMPHGYEPTREAAMAAFAKSWRRLGNRTN